MTLRRFVIRSLEGGETRFRGEHRASRFGAGAVHVHMRLLVLLEFLDRIDERVRLETGRPDEHPERDVAFLLDLEVALVHPSDVALALDGHPLPFEFLRSKL